MIRVESRVETCGGSMRALPDKLLIYYDKGQADRRRGRVKLATSDDSQLESSLELCQVGCRVCLTHLTDLTHLRDSTH